MPEIEAVVAARALFTLARAERVLDSSAFKAKAVTRLCEVAKGAVAATSSALEAKGATVEAMRAWLTKGAMAAERTDGCTAVATLDWRSSMSSA
jgi:hypothetical protein